MQTAQPSPSPRAWWWASARAPLRSRFLCRLLVLVLAAAAAGLGGGLWRRSSAPFRPSSPAGFRRGRAAIGGGPTPCHDHGCWRAPVIVQVDCVYCELALGHRNEQASKSRRGWIHIHEQQQPMMGDRRCPNFLAAVNESPFGYLKPTGRYVPLVHALLASSFRSMARLGKRGVACGHTKERQGKEASLRLPRKAPSSISGHALHSPLFYWLLTDQTHPPTLSSLTQVCQCSSSPALRRPACCQGQGPAPHIHGAARGAWGTAGSISESIEPWTRRLFAQDTPHHHEIHG